MATHYTLHTWHSHIKNIGDAKSNANASEIIEV